MIVMKDKVTVYLEPELKSFLESEPLAASPLMVQLLTEYKAKKEFESENPEYKMFSLPVPLPLVRKMKGTFNVKKFEDVLYQTFGDNSGEKSPFKMGETTFAFGSTRPKPVEEQTDVITRPEDIQGLGDITFDN